jgi:hypothetical protein
MTARAKAAAGVRVRRVIEGGGDLLQWKGPRDRDVQLLLVDEYT